jgi:hypothetical protein
VLFIEPNKIDQAMRDVDWVNAMHDELNNFRRNQVWEFVVRSKGHNVIGTKCVFQNKQDQDGIVVRNKVRLVVVTSGPIWNLAHSGPCECYEILWRV